MIARTGSGRGFDGYGFVFQLSSVVCRLDTCLHLKPARQEWGKHCGGCDPLPAKEQYMWICVTRLQPPPVGW
jgi:hypothetical protein